MHDIDINLVESHFDLERIYSLSLSEKFKLVKLIDLIYFESIYAELNGVKNLKDSKNFKKNKTYSLVAMLASHGLSNELFLEIIENYTKNFKKSDSYYGQLIILGIGVYFIMNNVSPKSIYNYLMTLLGKKFLFENLKYTGEPPKVEKDMDLNFEIKYKPFEGKMRKIKYELLALIKLSNEKNNEEIYDIINSYYNQKLLQLFYNLLNVNEETSMNKIYTTLKNKQKSREDNLILCGAYVLHKGYDIFTSHYLFNSIIGKYSRYDKEVEEIKNEMNLRKEEILKKF